MLMDELRSQELAQAIKKQPSVTYELSQLVAEPFLQIAKQSKTALALDLGPAFYPAAIMVVTEEALSKIFATVESQKVQRGKCVLHAVAILVE